VDRQPEPGGVGAHVAPPLEVQRVGLEPRRCALSCGSLVVGVEDRVLGDLLAEKILRPGVYVEKAQIAVEVDKGTGGDRRITAGVAARSGLERHPASMEAPLVFPAGRVRCVLWTVLRLYSLLRLSRCSEDRTRGPYKSITDRRRAGDRARRGYPGRGETSAASGAQ
jgi:hypothetical protein